jgi:stress response protein SCP2
MTQMSMGANIAIAAPVVRVVLQWSGGPGVPDVDVSALLVDDTGEVASDADFVFYNQPQHYSGSVRLAGKTPGQQASDVVDVTLATVPAAVQRIVIAASADGGSFGQVPGLLVQLLDGTDNAQLAYFQPSASEETAYVTGEFYRRDGAWKFRAVGQGYASGLAGLASDFGIDVGESEPTASPPAAEPAPGAAPDVLATPALPPLPPLPAAAAPAAEPAPAPRAPAAAPVPPVPPAPPALPPLGPPAAEPAAAFTPPPAFIPPPPPGPPVPAPALDLSAPSLDLSAPAAEPAAAPLPPAAPPAAPPPVAPPPASGPAAPDLSLAPLPPLDPPMAPPTAPASPLDLAPPDPPAAPPADIAPSAALTPPAPDGYMPPTPPGPPVGAPPATPGRVSLVKNQRVDLARTSSVPLGRLVFSLGWTPAEGKGETDLDASVIAFDASGEKLAIVWYMHLNEFYGALQHTGDNRKGGQTGVEQVLVDLTRLPAQVASLVFTINSFRGQTFTDIAHAYCVVQNFDDGSELVRYDLTDTQPSTALLMSILKRTPDGGWDIRAIGEFHDFRTVKKLLPSASRQALL